MADVEALLDAEAALRIEFAAKQVAFAEIAYKLRALLHMKEQLAQASFEAGHPIRDKVGTTEMPTWSRLIGTEGALKLAQDQLLMLARA